MFHSWLVLLTGRSFFGQTVAESDTPWLEKTMELFGVIEVSNSFILVVSLLIVVAVILLILKGFLSELKRKK